MVFVMKRMALILIFLLLASILPVQCALAGTSYYYDDAWHAYEGNTLKLRVNGQILKTEMPPIVFNDYTVVPARDVFERLGAKVEWIANTQHVIISSSVKITLKINSQSAVVGNKTISMPIAPKIINGKTMIPTRFVGETLGHKVSFDSATDTVIIDQSEQEYITDMKYSKENSAVRVELGVNSSNPEYKSFILNAPLRLVVDIEKASFSKKPADINVGSGNITAIRSGQIESAARVVFDLTEDFGYNVSSSGQSVIITVNYREQTGSNPSSTDPFSLITIKSWDGSDYFETVLERSTAQKYTSPDRIELTLTGHNIPQKSAEKKFDANVITAIKYSAVSANSAKVVIMLKDCYVNMVDNKDCLYMYANKPVQKRSVMIDAGHGGSDVGAVGYDENGTAVAYEKDFNLDVALKIKGILTKNNVEVRMIRQSDTYVDYKKIGSIANEAGVSLFVSIHTNSSTVVSAKGIETWGFLDEGASVVNGMTGKRLCELIQNELIYATKAQDRGVKNGNDLAVIRTTSMPATLVEMGFISNKSEREKLMNESYRQTIAEAVAAGIMLAFNEMGI